ncbi:uncharacterized protein LOC143562576 [Bidens hawaiensis]|uniref:uncharacterized protein LOC143562576 n=1 Tax=Bidens hawaiensis TaxID=980011 RepID=UPI00404B4B49
MEDKKLDLNAPLLSVRLLDRSSSVGKSRPTRQQPLPVKWEPEQEVTKPAAIPFIWEQIPGQAKNQKKHISNQPKTNPNSSTDEQSSEDAFESLSMSFSCNYSEENNNNSDAESIASFCSDLSTREYLMSRFIPAAKSMIIETPQYAAKKQEVAIPEPPKYGKKVYSGELRPLLLERYPVNSHNNKNNVKDNEEDKESVVVEDLKKKSSKKGFGFFLPRICTKRSSCLSNAMPGPKTKTKFHQSQSPAPGSPAPGLVPRLSRRTSYSGPLTPSLEKQAMDAVIQKRAESRPKEAHETQQKTYPLNRSSNSLPSSPHRGNLSRSGRISPYRNESPRSPFHDGARFLGVPKDVQNQIVQPKPCPSLNVKSHFSPRLVYDNPLPVAPEKTMYIDWNEKPTNLTTNETKIGSNDDVEGPVCVPPLPKSPSESWLRRKMSLRNPFPKKMQQIPVVEKSPKNGPKWETIVKTSNVHHDHVRYSEELLNVSKYPEISF